MAPKNSARTSPHRELLHQMLRIRRFEERCVELYSDEKIRGFMHLYIGEEAVAVGICAALALDDAIVSTYREHGHALVRGVPATVIMAEMYGRVAGCSRGRGGSMHIFDAEHRFYGGNAIVGGGLPLAVGLALADKMQGRSRVTACFFGDGAMAEGEFHECVNLAALWRLRGFDDVTVGSTAVQVPSRADRPVIVIRSGLPPALRHGMRIVVGIDGSSASEAALGFAFEVGEVRVDVLRLNLALDALGR